MGNDTELFLIAQCNKGAARIMRKTRGFEWWE